MSAPTIEVDAPAEAQTDEIQEALDQAEAAHTVGAELEKAPAGYLTLDPTSKELTNAQKSALMGLGLDCNDKQAWPHIALFIHTCQAAGLDPFRKQAYLIKRGGKWVNADGETRGKDATYTYQTGIDGFRTMGGRTGRFIKRVGPFWAGPDSDADSWVYDPVAKVMRKRWYEVWPDVWGYPTFARIDIHFINTKGADDVHEQTGRWSDFVPMMPVYAYDKNTKKREKQYDKSTGAPAEDVADMWKKMGPHMLGKCTEAQAFRSVFPDQCGSFYAPEELHRADAEEMLAAAADATANRREAFEKARAARSVPTQRTDRPAEHKVIEHDPEEPTGRLQLSEDEMAAGLAPLPEPVTVGVEQPADVVDDVEEPGPELYLAELTCWAELYGKTLPEMLARQLTAKRLTDPAELGVVVLADQVKQRRPYTVARLRDSGRNADAAAVEEGALLHTRTAE